MATKRGPKSPMTKDHKEALAKGRSEGAAVRAYLEGLRSNRPTRGRKRTAESIQRRLDAVAEALNDADPLNELKLIQEQMDLRAELEGMDEDVDMSGLEEAFLAVAKSYSDRQGISYAAWRQVGVQAATLKSAGITRAG